MYRYIHMFNTMYEWYWSDYWCLNLMSGKYSCRKASMADTFFSVHGSFMYLPFLAKICLSRRQFTMKSAGMILWASVMFTFHSLPVRSETFNYLVPFSFTTLKFGTYSNSELRYIIMFVMFLFKICFLSIECCEHVCLL